jgi:hypothetical protein
VSGQGASDHRSGIGKELIEEIHSLVAVSPTFHSLGITSLRHCLIHPNNNIRPGCRIHLCGSLRVIFRATDLSQVEPAINP